MTAKKGSLTFPANPLAAMQELAALDARPTVPVPQEDVLTSRQQDSLTDSYLSDKLDSQTASQTDDKIDIQPDGLMDSKTDRQKARQTHRKPDSHAPEIAVAEAVASELDPLDQALLHKLGRAYPDLSKEKSTLVSSRLPDDLVERLGLAADLVKKHKKNKQDVIARGLILAFQELVDNAGAVEWYE